MPLRSVSLDDRYERRAGRVYMTGLQALVRLPLEQRAADAARGLNTAGYITGYRGSPLGAYDMELEREAERLERNHIVFQPGLNEDLAATACWGTQQAGYTEGMRYEGVFALWYGKGPGVDRSGDPFKHGTRNGTAPKGGVLVVFGDDHAGKSSTTAHQSDPQLAANGIPVVYPATIGEIIEFGLFGWALSRFSGLWVGLKCVNETAEATATVDLPGDRRDFLTPEVARPEDGLHTRVSFDPYEEERIQYAYRLPAALAFARANPIDRVARDSDRRELGIVTAGKAYLDTIDAFDLLGLDAQSAARLGLRVYKPGLIWPLEPDGLTSFARGHRDLLFIEEKVPMMEEQASRILYHLPEHERPTISGKTDPQGAPLLPDYGVLDPIAIAEAIGARLWALGLATPALEARLALLRAGRERTGRSLAASTARRPWYCSGCPHNSSTKVPEGSLARSGIGCHTMAIWMDRETGLPVQMGGEGANWIGMAPFSDRGHIFQNLGDGTYNHSGLLAIRAAVAAKVNITYKILYNDAVAMTGGQANDGTLSVPDILNQVLAEKVARVDLLTSEPERYRGVALPQGVIARHREELDVVQRELRDTPGVTVLVYDQTCAAELRRRRKRGLAPDPPKRVFINDAVCEGCGDCSVQSNCVSVLPKETALGLKREIDQSSCNKDYSCVKGFCPSFVTLEGARPRKASAADLNSLALDELPASPASGSDASILIAGIGGTGIVTLGAVLGMAAHLEGKRFAAYDMTGLAQKGGAVYSHLRITERTDDDISPRICSGTADVMIGCDLTAAATGDALAAIGAGHTRIVLNEHAMPLGRFQIDQTVDFSTIQARRLIGEAAGGNTPDVLRASEMARALLGDTIGANMMLLGFALQKGLLPVSREALHRAIEINGVAIDFNKRALELGRAAAARPETLESLFRERQRPQTREDLTSLEGVIAHRSRLLAAYQDEAYATRYREVVARASAAERKALGREGAFCDAVARYAYKVMAYKDEYEVARLYTEGNFQRQLAKTFEDGGKIKVHLAPPLIAPRDPVTGLPRKIAFGAWILPAFRILARFKRLRGTPVDIFGYTRERRDERAWRDRYLALIDDLSDRLSAGTHATAVEIARLPDEVRGFGHVKERNLAVARRRLEALLARLEERAVQPASAEEGAVNRPAEPATAAAPRSVPAKPILEETRSA